MAAALVVLLALVSPARGSAADAAAPVVHSYAFRVGGSNGYGIVAFAASSRADGRGVLAVFVSKRLSEHPARAGIVSEAVSYEAPATVTATQVEADLGPLGRVDLAVSGSGTTKVLHRGCGSGKPVRYEPPRFSGNFEFHGEEGYTNAVNSSPRDYTEFFPRLVCAGRGSGEIGGGSLPGARLRLRSHAGAAKLSLQANQNHPGGRTRLEISLSEKRGEMHISREMVLWDKSAAFQFDDRLLSATLAPPPPFAGHGSFRRTASGPRWSGDLTVDLPGRSGLPLTAPGTTATLVHSCWQGEGAGTRADCGFP